MFFERFEWDLVLFRLFYNFVFNYVLVCYEFIIGLKDVCCGLLVLVFEELIFLIFDVCGSVFVMK